ncbi:MAG: starch-binding protein, partial [Acutalibacteraceae bacterium]|nr:starch-binding protein [Acutalibacteraceae bacterium]
EMSGNENPQSSKDGDNNTTLPASIDHSTSKYFPPIGDQGSIGSCTVWSELYYQFGFAMNKHLDREGTAENTFSPKWVYNFANGSTDKGSSAEAAYKVIQMQGCPPMSMFQYDKDYLGWSTDEKVWRAALDYRLKSSQFFTDPGRTGKEVTSPDDSDIAAMKTAISNGDLLSFTTYINSWKKVKLKKHPDAPENSNFVNEYSVISRDGSSGCHRMTIVGYNDNIWTDVNNNGNIDKGEMGAFKVVNSWGDDYANHGFIWLSYDALNHKSSVAGAANASNRSAAIYTVSRLEVEEHKKGSELYLKTTINTPDRRNTDIKIIAESDGVKKEYSAFSFVRDKSITEKYSINGSKTTSNDATMLFPLNNVIQDITPDNFKNYHWSVQFIEKKSDGSVLTVKDAEIVDEKHNRIYKPENVYPFTLDGSNKTFKFVEQNTNSVVVYYRGYENPDLHYIEDGKSWDTAVKVDLPEDMEQKGYTHKYSIEFDEQTDVLLYFSDDKGNIDNNNGQYYKATTGNNYFETKGARDALTLNLTNSFDSIADIDRICEFNVDVKGGYAPYTYEMVFQNLDKGSFVTTDRCENSKITMPFTTTGNYMATLTVTDFAGNEITATNNFTIKDFPFEINKFTVTPDLQVMTGDKLSFTAVTQNESIISSGTLQNEYRFVIINNDTNEVAYQTTKNADSVDYLTRSSVINLSWLPRKGGNYSITVSSTDEKHEQAKNTINLTVTEYNGTILGDADNSGNITVADALRIMKYNIGGVNKAQIWLLLSDCNKDNAVDLKDAICILRHCVTSKDCAFVGEVNHRELPTEPPTEKPTVAPTEKPTEAPTVPVEENIVTFTNSLNWDGTIYCYYWSDSNTSMTTWPGKPMSYARTNSMGQKQYTFNVPDSATYLIFTNGNKQTVDIPYDGGEMKYYAKETTDSKGHYEFATWK